MRVRLLAGAALIACMPALPTLAQEAPPPAQTPPSPPSSGAPSADGLTPDGLYVSADAARREGDVVTASGTADERVSPEHATTASAPRKSLTI